MKMLDCFLKAIKKPLNVKEKSEMLDSIAKEKPDASTRTSTGDEIIPKLKHSNHERSPPSRKRPRLAEELKARKQQEEDDELFGVNTFETDLNYQSVPHSEGTYNESEEAFMERGEGFNGGESRKRRRSSEGEDGRRPRVSGGSSATSQPEAINITLLREATLSMQHKSQTKAIIYRHVPVSIFRSSSWPIALFYILWLRRSLV